MSKVSAVITTYKRNVNTLRRAVESVCEQSYNDVELIIIDDNGLGSKHQKDNEEFINKLSSRYEIRYVPLKVNSGVQFARNKGIEVSSGKYLAFLDDDDIWYKDKIRKQIEIFNEYGGTNLGLVYCWYESLKEDQSSSFSRKIITLPEYSQEVVLTKLSQKNFIGSTSFPLIKKSVFKTVGNFDLNLKASQDYDMWIRIAENFELRCVKEPLAAYVIHSGESITKNYFKKAHAEITFLKKHYKLIRTDSKSMHIKHKSIGIYLMRLGKGKEAREFFRIAIKHQPIGIRVYKYYLESYYLQYKLKNQG